MRDIQYLLTPIYFFFFIYFCEGYNFVGAKNLEVEKKNLEVQEKSPYEVRYSFVRKFYSFLFSMCVHSWISKIE